MRTYSLPDVIELLRTEVAQSPSGRAYARSHGLSAAYVQHVLIGRTDPGPKILKCLGLERVPVVHTPRYRRVAP